jgi:hypothetical protein
MIAGETYAKTMISRFQICFYLSTELLKLPVKSTATRFIDSVIITIHHHEF